MGGFRLGSCNACVVALHSLCLLQPQTMGNWELLSGVSGTMMSHSAVEQAQHGMDGILQSLQTSFQKCLCLNLLEFTIKWLVKAICYLRGSPVLGNRCKTTALRMEKKGKVSLNYVLTEHNQEKNESEENNLDPKGAAKANTEAHGSEVGCGKRLSEILMICLQKAAV